MAYYPPGQQIVLFGGDTPFRHGSEHSLGDTWVFGAHGWRRRNPLHSPPARCCALMAYDPATRLLLLFGGSSDTRQSSRVLFDTWAWDGADWTQLKAVRLPTWMPGAPIAWDPAARRVTELAPRPGCPCSDPVPGDFHDSTGRGRVGRWLWTGRSWSWSAEHPAPGTEGGVFAPDPLSGGMLYYSYSPPAPTYGGPIPRDPTGTRYSQTWLWHDGHFTKESPSRAPAWDNALMVSDARIGRTVVIGETGRLWAWTGTTWQPLASGRGPPTGAAAVYDPSLGDLVIFGTKTYSSSPTSQTWLWNATRWIIAP